MSAEVLTAFLLMLVIIHALLIVRKERGRVIVPYVDDTIPERADKSPIEDS